VGLAIPIARVWVTFVGIGFLLGQLYFGDFSLGASLASICGLGVGAFGSATKTRTAALATIAICFGGLIGAALDSSHYYRYLDIPGNSYPWLLVGLFVLALGLICWPSLKSLDEGA
jgi:hypothetical protein